MMCQSNDRPMGTSLSAPDEGTNQRAGGDVVSDEISAVRAQQRRLESKIATLERSIVSTAPGEPEPAEPEVVAPESLEEQRAADRTRTAAYAATVRTRFSGESEGTWGTDTRGAIADRLANQSAFPGLSIDNIDCRETMCQLLVTLPDLEATMTFSQAMSSDPLFAGGGFAHMVWESGGERQYEVYVARPGHPL